MHEPSLIKTLGTRDSFTRLRPYVKEYCILPESYEIIEDMGQYYKEHESEETLDWDNFVTWSLVTRHSSWNESQRETYKSIINVVKGAVPDPAIVDRLDELSTAIDAKEAVEEAIYKGGTGSLERAGTLIDSYRERLSKGGHNDPLAPYDLRDIFKSLARSGGLYWRLPELNKAIGPLCRGDFVLVGKRPEVGGTTFLTSEFTHMVTQLEDGQRAVIFNNEEARDKVYARLIQSALNTTVMDMAADPEDTLTRYASFLGAKEIDVIHDTALSMRTVEEVLKRKEYHLIGFNVLWKIRGNYKLDDIQRYERLGQWARTLADKYGPVVAIWQADAAAEGEAWLTQDRLYGSKTALQGEADVLMMIGKVHEPGKQDERYINVCKNKIPGSSGTDPKLRHGKMVVDIDPERGRFIGRIK